MICYWDKTHFLDANAGPLIAAWDYVEATGDQQWLARRIERLEFIADFLARRDVDGDGLVEATQSGNYGTLKEPARSCAWWDALNCGGKDSYSNALIYRAWRCLADLEAEAEPSRPASSLHATRRPAQGRLLQDPPESRRPAGWRGGKARTANCTITLHPSSTGWRLSMGWLRPSKAAKSWRGCARKWRRLASRALIWACRPCSYRSGAETTCFPDAIGCPQREDGRDTFGYYMNGGITAGQVLHFLAAHYVVGERAPADRILRAMLERQARGEFQNGAVNAYPKGIDWTTWDGPARGLRRLPGGQLPFPASRAVARAPFARGCIARSHRPDAV